MVDYHDIHPATGLRAGAFGIGTYDDGTRRFPAIVRPDGDVIDIGADYADTHAVFDDWPRSFERLQAIAARGGGATHRFAALRPLPPLAHPQVLCAGANYKTHSAQMMTNNQAFQHLREPGESDASFFQRNLALMERRAREGTPFIFPVPHSALAGAHDDFVMPVIGENNEYETELAFVIGRPCRHATPAQAEQMIAGYLVVNDLGAIDQFRRTDIPWGYDWISKYQPTAKLCGPFIVPAPFVQADALRITFKLNGEVKQDWPTDDMIFTPPRIAAYLSERMRLLPGDMVLTGSPPGNGSHHGRFLKEGDLIEGNVSGMGWHRNRCVKEAAPPHPLTVGLWKNAAR